MGHKVLCITFISLVAFSATKAESSQQQDVEAGDPYLQSLAEFAAGTLVSNDIVDPSIDGGAWMLHRILDAQYVPPNPPAQPAVYFFTLELSLECNNDTSHVPACDETNSTYVRLCEVAVADEPWAKRRSLVPGKIACASQESSNELAFVGTTVANSVPLDDLALVAVAQEALAQMASKTNGQHSLVRIESAKRLSDSDTVTYYLALNITTQTTGSATSQVSHEICEVSMEEVPVVTEAGSADVPTKVESILRSLRCFSTGDEDEAERLGLQKFLQEDLSAPHVRTAVLAAYGQIDGEFQSNFKLKLLGSKVLRTVVSLDSGTRDSRLQLGLGSSFCIKRPDLEQEEQDELKTCNLDPDRDTFVCDITVIQWPWVADAFLFSDLTCQPTNVSSIAAQLEPLFEAEAEESTEDSGEVQGNGLEDDQDAEGKAEIIGNTGPCTGCPQEANVQDPKIQKLANFALSYMEAKSNEPTKQSIVEVKKATVQVVAGIKYELTLQLAQTNCKKGEAEEQCVPNLDTSKVCVVEVLEQSWRNSTEVLGVECMQTSVPPVLDSPVREARLTGRSDEEKPLSPKPIRPTLGGWKAVDPESESIQSYAKVALEHFNSQSNSESVGKLVKIVSAKAQVVAGTNVNLQLEVGFTGCKKGEDSQANCDLDEKQNHEICDVSIFKNLEGSSTVKSLNCKTVMTEELEMSASSLSEDIDESPFVGEAPKVFKDPEFLSRQVSSPVLGRNNPAGKKSQGIGEFISLAMKAVNEQSNDGSFLMVSRVISATSARSGELETPIGIRLTLEVGSIDCSKGLKQPCTLAENDARQICDVGLEERPWLNLRKVTSVDCKPAVTEARNKAPRNADEVEAIVTGGIQEANSESDEIREYAEFAVPHVQAEANFGYVLKLVEILSSTTQVVAGKSVTIEMVLGQTNCAIGSEEAVNGPCDLDDNKHRQTCTVTIWDRPWLKLRETTEITCHAVGFPLVFNKEEEVTEFVDVPAVGGITEADVQSPEIQEYAQFALPNIEAGTNSGYTLKLVEVLSATIHVVEGQSVTVKMVLGQTSCKIGSEEAANGPCEVDNNKPRQTCTVQIWDRPWLNSREITQMSCESVGIPLVKAALEVVRDDNEDAPPPPGSPVPIDVDAEEIQTLLPVAINGINQQSNEAQVLKVIRVQNAFKKVVAGILYRLILEVGVTSCAKGAEADSCEVNPDKPRQICDVEVLEQPWTSTREVQKVECHAIPGVAHQYGRQERADAIAAELVVSSPPFLGGINEVAVDDESVKEIAQFATTTIAAQQNQEGGLQLIKIQKARKQVVAGWKYFLTLELGSVDGKDDNQICEAVVFDRPWTQTRELSDVKCSITISGPRVAKSKRLGLLGGISPADPADRDVQEVAEFATTTIAARQNEAGGLKLIKIKEARRQIVAGTKYYLTLELGSADGQGNNQVCEVVVVDVPWEQLREMSDVKCSIATSGGSRSAKSVQLGAAAPRTGASSRGVPGGISSANPADPDVQEIAQFATTAVAAKQNQAGGLKLVSIKKVRTQVVAGTNYFLTLELASVNGQGANQICELVVFDQVWTQTREVSDIKCAVARSGSRSAKSVQLGAAAPRTGASSRGVPGGISSANPADPDVQEIAQFATTAVAAKQNQAGGLKLVSIKKVRTQVVAGTNYFLTLELASVNGQGANQICELVVFDQVWTQTREVSDIKCAVARSGSRSAKSVQLGAAAPRTGASSRGVPGGISSANPADPDVQEIAQFATTAVAAKQNQAGGLKLVSIKKVRTQVVAGTNYFLTLELASVNGQGANQICELVVFDQVWTQTREVSDIKCSVARSGARITKNARSGAGPSPVSVPRGLVGGLSPANPADPTVREIAQFATSTIAAQQNQAGGLNLVNIKQAKTQTVAGTNYYLTLELGSVNGQGANQVCEVVVFDQEWTKTRKVSDVKCSASGSRKKRDVEPIRSSEATPPNNSLKSIAIDDPKVQEMSAFVVPIINQRSNAPNPLHLVKTHTAFTRVVSGLKYYLVIEVSTSNCTPSDTNDCKAEHRKGAQYCQVVVWEQAWLNKKEVTDLSCASTKPKARHNPKNKGKKNPARKGGARAGAASSVGVATPDIQEYATFALNEINAQSNDQQHLVLTQIREATSQVVSGKNIGLTLEVGYSNCTKGNANVNCEVDPARIKQVCRVKIWDRPWLNDRRVMSLKCEEPAARRHGTKKKSSRVVRQILGGFSEGNPKDPEVKTMADFAVRFLRWNGNVGVTVVEVKSVQKQLVSGMNYKMSLLVSPTSCDKPCPVEECDITVYDQPWTGTRRVAGVSCAPVRRKREAIEEESGHLYYMEAFRGFLAKFRKVYATMEEFEHRYHVYRVNQERIQYMQENEQGTAQYGDTEFSDLTEEEFRALYTGFRPDLKGNHIVDQAVIPNITLPDAFDWRTYNVVTPVKNQGMCGSCWAYSVTGNVEGLYAVKHNKLHSLSEQELVDCDKLDQGCNGGLPENAYKAIQEFGGLETEEDYPYEGKDDQCRIKPEKAAVQVTGSVEISQNETEMAKWLVANGPISIGINANAMQFYNGGVSHPWKFLCNAKSIDHGVLIVGYGIKEYPLFNKTLPYWIVKNSWGNRWGEQGYYRVYRGDGTCGVNMMATSAVVN